MKHIGLLGGVSPVSTGLYYQSICQRHNIAKGLNNGPEMTIRSLNLQTVVDLLGNSEIDDHDIVGKIVKGVDNHNLQCYLSQGIRDLENSGAQIGAICSNTMHLYFDEIQKRVDLPLVDIRDSVIMEVERRLTPNSPYPFPKIGILGTEETMVGDVYATKLRERGFVPVIPNPQRRSQIDSLIFDQLCIGDVESPKPAYCMAMLEFAEAGVAGVILGCTELSYCVGAAKSNMELFDSTQLHIKDIYEKANLE